MSDFYQTGCVTTLHRLNPDGLPRLEAELRHYAQSRPIGLVLPALYSEFENPAMRGIVDELASVDYLRHIVVALGRASRAEYQKARRFFDGFPNPVTFLWIDSPHVQTLLHMLEQRGLSAGQDGKGRSCWLSYGYLLDLALEGAALDQVRQRLLAGEPARLRLEVPPDAGSRGGLAIYGETLGRYPLDPTVLLETD